MRFKKGDKFYLRGTNKVSEITAYHGNNIYVLREVEWITVSDPMDTLGAISMVGEHELSDKNIWVQMPIRKEPCMGLVEAAQRHINALNPCSEIAPGDPVASAVGCCDNPRWKKVQGFNHHTWYEDCENCGASR